MADEMATCPIAATGVFASDIDQILSACDRFFSIHELVSAFLHETDTPVLVNCQSVCAEEAVKVRLNPILGTHFQSLLGIHERIQLSQNRHVLRTSKYSYGDLQKLPWARDSTYTRADGRSAFARREASWRKMLVSQPPMRHLDWWHEWESSHRQRDVRYSQYPNLSGGGHQQVSSDITTIGALWDMLEARLLRGCASQVTFFVAGGSAEDDPTASEDEKKWETESRSKNPEFTMNFPRIRVCTYQVWPGDGPAMYQRFDVPIGAWEIRDELPFTPQTDRERRKYEIRDGDGLFWLTSDFAHDVEDVNWRWSRSDAFENAKMRRVTSRVTGSESRRSSRLRERNGQRREAYSA